MSAPKKKSSMSVPEMRKMLGLGKTEGYYLVHKNYFDVILINGEMRVVISSFEKWYASQVKYRKINGAEPGKVLRKDTLSILEIADLLDVSHDTVQHILQTANIDTFFINTQCRIVRKSFMKWYNSQTHYRLPAERQKDQDIEDATMTFADMGRALGISRNNAYMITQHYKEQFIFVTVADKKRVTKESFENWYAVQRRYCKVSEPVDTPPQTRRIEKVQNETSTLCKTLKPRLSISEAAAILQFDERRVYRLIDDKEIEAKKVGIKWYVSSESVHAYLQQQSK